MRGWTSKPPPGIQIDRTHPLRPDICHLLNEGAGLKTWDAARRIQSSAFVNGPVFQGIGMRFVYASTQYVPLALNALAVNNAPFTMFATIQTTAGALGGQTIYSQGLSSTTAPLAFMDNNNTAGLLRGLLRNDASSSINVSVSSTGYNDGRPHSVAFVSEGNGGLIRLYLDGRLIGSASNSLGTGAMTFDQSTIGARGSTLYSFPWDGDIGLFYGYYRALTTNDIVALHVQPYAMFLRPLGLMGVPLATGSSIVPLSAYYRMMGMR